MKKIQPVMQDNTPQDGKVSVRVVEVGGEPAVQLSIGTLAVAVGAEGAHQVGMGLLQAAFQVASMPAPEEKPAILMAKRAPLILPRS